MTETLRVTWVVLAGAWLAVGYALAALLCFLTVVGTPAGRAALRMARYTLWPFDATLVAAGGGTTAARTSAGDVAWLVVAGWWLALVHLVAGLLLCLTVVGLPVGVAVLSLLPVSLRPRDKEAVALTAAVRPAVQVPRTSPVGSGVRSVPRDVRDGRRGEPYQVGGHQGHVQTATAA